MAKNPFKQTPPALDPKRNAFDLSFSNNLTMKIGKLIPVMCKEVIPGDSFEIDANFGLRFMPTYFPIQNRVRADLHFFYVRTRNLWKNWKKFIGNTPTPGVPVVPPYIGKKTSEDGFFAEGSLSDYLGVPTNTISSAYNQYCVSAYEYLPSSTRGVYGGHPTSQSLKSLNTYIHGVDSGNMYDTTTDAMLWQTLLSVDSAPYPDQVCIIGEKLHGRISFGQKFSCLASTESTAAIMNKLQGQKAQLIFLSYKDGGFRFVGKSVGAFDYDDTPNALSKDTVITRQGIYYLDGGSNNDKLFFDKFDYSKLFVGILLPNTGLADLAVKSSKDPDLHVDFSGVGFTYFSGGANYQFDQAANVYDPAVLPISALPYRAYESIYNGFYRNERVDPLLKTVNGNQVPVYDEFLPTDDDGVDDTPYELYNRYWERDFLTTCVPSPQQGSAPLVGLNMTVDGRDSQFVSRQKMTIIDGGTEKDIQVAVRNTSDGLQSVVGIQHYDTTIPIGSIEALQSAIDYGISINDFRNVNALQRWLEINERRGYLYKDQIMSHFGVDVKFEELNMPEFIGGVSQDINSSVVYNNSGNSDMALGDYAGTMTCFGSGQHKIHKYCDEHGFIMAILSISPIPVYSQLMPKMFLKNHHLDYFFPEFGHIGFQPVTMQEVSPLQAFESGGASKLKQVFGYQRAFYDYVSSTDEAHGNFRSNLRNYLINREFGTLPILSGQFLKISPEEVNDVFNSIDNTDKVVGQVNFHITAKRPIPFFGTPKLCLHE